MSTKRVRMLSVLKVLKEVEGLYFRVINNGHEFTISYQSQTTLVRKFHGFWKYGNRWVLYPQYPGCKNLSPTATHTLWTPYEARDFTSIAEGIVNTCARRADPR